VVSSEAYPAFADATIQIDTPAMTIVHAGWLHVPVESCGCEGTQILLSFVPMSNWAPGRSISSCSAVDASGGFCRALSDVRHSCILSLP